MQVYICTKFHVNILDAIEVRTQVSFKIQRGIVRKTCGHGVTVLFLCTSSDVDLHLYKVA